MRVSERRGREQTGEREEMKRRNNEEQTRKKLRKRKSCFWQEGDVEMNGDELYIEEQVHVDNNEQLAMKRGEEERGEEKGEERRRRSRAKASAASACPFRGNLLA